jgi:hypothetical protein
LVDPTPRLTVHSRCSSKALDLPQPLVQLVPIRENPGHHPLACDTSDGSSPNRLIELHAFI